MKNTWLFQMILKFYAKLFDFSGESEEQKYCRIIKEIPTSKPVTLREACRNLLAYYAETNQIPSDKKCLFLLHHLVRLGPKDIEDEHTVIFAYMRVNNDGQIPARKRQHIYWYVFGKDLFPQRTTHDKLEAILLYKDEVTSTQKLSYV